MRGRLLRHIALLALLMVCVPVVAQTHGNDSTHVIAEVEVMGVSGRDDIHSLVPQYSFSSADFRRLNISDMTSALRRLPGVTLRDYGGAGGMKTVSVRGLGSQHTCVALDGFVLSDAQSGQIDLQQFQLGELSSLSLSIAGDDDIFQPARNLFRGSLISITTSDSVRNAVGLEAGSWGLLAPSLRLGKRIGNLSLMVQGEYTTAQNNYPFTVENGIATHSEKRTHSALSQGNVNVSTSWRMAPEMTLKSLVRLYDNDRELPGLVRLYTNDNDETLRDRGVLAQTMLTSRLSSRVWMKNGLRWNWSEQRYHNGIPSGGIKSEHYIQREYYATTALLYQPAPDIDVDYSVDIFHNSMTTTLQGNPSPRRTSFLQSLSAKVVKGDYSFVAQCLNTHIDSEHHLAPSVSASYKPFGNDRLMLRMAAKNSIRMPSMTELYYYHIGSSELLPEETVQLNMGLTHAGSWMDSRLRETLTADIYINKVKDKIVAIPFNMFVWRYMNVSEVMGRGADITASLAYETPSVGTFSFTANYSYQRVGLHNVAVDKFEDNQIAYTPEHSGSATLAWLNPWVNVSTTFTGAAKQWTNNEHNGAAIPAYHEVAASLYRTFRLSRYQSMEASIVVQNIFDSQYCIIAHYPMPGRNVKVGMTYKF